MDRDLTRQPPVALLVATAWLVVACILLMPHWQAGGAPDSDDAMRLVQLRAFLAGRGWFDLHEPRVYPPFGYDSHWSRLIDAGLAGLYGLLRLFSDVSRAEWLMAATWPLLWLLPAITASVTIAWRIAGREAALVALLLFLIGTPAYLQFTPGRIDHHNVQIALAMLTLAATAWADRRSWPAWAAGGLTGSALAIGLESLPYLAMCGVAFALRYVVDPRAAPALRAYGNALAVATVVGFLASVGPEHWTLNACDALAMNLAMPVVVGGFGLALAGALPSDKHVMRAVAVCACGVAALVLFAATEPRCLGGPFAMVDPAVWSVWLDGVHEMQPLPRLWQKMPLVAAAVTAFPAAALVAAFALARQPELRRDLAFLLVAAAFGLAAVMTLLAVKTFSYAVWFGMPLVAAAALRLFTALRLTNLAARVVMALLLTPTALSAGAIMIAEAAGLQDTDTSALAENAPCRDVRHYAPLARLPRGVVATHVNYGPFVLAWTPHAVLAAPYHRLSGAILAAHRAIAAPPKEARDVVLGAGATYVVVCGRADKAETPSSLWAQLKAGAVPDWLEPVAETQGRPLLVFRVKR